LRCTLHGRCTEKCRETVGSGDVFAYSAHLLRRGSMPRAIADPSQMALKSTNKLNLPKRSAASILKTDRQDRSSAVGERALSVWGLGFRADLQQRRSKCSSFVSDEQTFKETSVFQKKREQTRTNDQSKPFAWGEQRAYGNTDSADGRLCHSPLGSHQAKCLGNRRALDRSFRCKHGLFL